MGLSVIGVTGESEEKTEPWIKKHGVKYPYAYMKGDALSGVGKTFGWRGYPASALIDPQGNVVWSGHPGGINSGLIKKHLRGADRTPVAVRVVSKNWPKDETKSVVKKLLSSDYGGALKAAKKLDGELKDKVVGDLNKIITKCTEDLKAKYEQGDFLGFQMGWDELKKPFKGLDEAKDLEALAKKLKKDKAAKAVIKAQKMLLAIEQKLETTSNREEIQAAMRQVQKLIDSNRQTYVATQGEKLIEDLEARL